MRGTRFFTKMKIIATVEGGVEIKPTYEYIDAKVDGEIFKKFATSPQTTLTTTVAEINVENMADFLMGGIYSVNASSVEELTFDGDHTPKECYILYVMEDTATSAKYVAVIEFEYTFICVLVRDSPISYTKQIVYGARLKTGMFLGEIK